jgi:hypothetical protein
VFETLNVPTTFRPVWGPQQTTHGDGKVYGHEMLNKLSATSRTVETRPGGRRLLDVHAFNSRSN